MTGVIRLTEFYEIVNCFLRGSTIVCLFNFSWQDMMQERKKILFQGSAVGNGILDELYGH
jgi:hypothetical protein